MNITDIYEDSPNNYRIVAGAPKDIDEAIRYYLDQFDVYDKRAYPMEWAMINYGIARKLLCDKTQIKVNDMEGRAKRIENALYYFNQTLEVFTYRNYPVMFALINMYMAKLFRERSMLFSKRSFLSQRGSPEESLEFGLDQAMEALPVLSLSKTLLVEHALCCLEIGHLYVLISEYPQNAHDHSLREQAITYLERVLTLLSKIPAQVLYIPSKGKAYKWSFEDSETYPKHIAIWLDGFGRNYIEGCAYYLLGRVEQGWGLVVYGDEHPEEHLLPSSNGEKNAHNINNQQVLDPTIDTTTPADKAKPVAIVDNTHIYQAYNHFTTAFRPALLPINCNYWADAHHRTALLIVKYPELVDPEFFSPGNANKKSISFAQTFLFLDMAIDHFIKALKCPVLSKTEKMDLHFHLAQTHMMKLQRVIDQVPYGQSITRAIRENDGLETMGQIETHLKQALQRVTAANNQSVQDAYLYFYASLKLAEYRMLQAACAPSVGGANNVSTKTGMTMMDREEHLFDAMGYLIDACIARPLADNIDLHYIATGQLAQILVAVKRPHAAAKAYAKVLFCMSVLINRSFFNYTKYHFEKKLRPDATRHVSTAFSQAVKEIHWIKLHLGPMKLHEKVAPGYANWSFEDIPSVRHAINSGNSDAIIRKKRDGDADDDADHSGVLAAKFTSDSPAMSTQSRKTMASDEALTTGNNDPYRVIKPVPPKGVPPLQLNHATGTKKVFVDGVAIPGNIYEHHNNLENESNVNANDIDNMSAITTVTKKSKPTIEDFKPPPGPVPLTALGHSIPLDLQQEQSNASAPVANNTTATQKLTSFLSSMSSNSSIVDNDKRLPNSPYTYRLRLRIPPLQEMREIDKENRVAFSMGRGKVAYLMPKRAPMIVANAAGAKKQAEFRQRAVNQNQQERNEQEEESEEEYEENDDTFDENIPGRQRNQIPSKKNTKNRSNENNSVVSGITTAQDGDDDDDYEEDDGENLDDRNEKEQEDKEEENENEEKANEENEREMLMREGRPRSQRVVGMSPNRVMENSDEEDDHDDETTVTNKPKQKNPKKRGESASSGGFFGIFFKKNKKQKPNPDDDVASPPITPEKMKDVRTQEIMNKNDHDAPIENMTHQKKLHEEARKKQPWIKRFFSSSASASSSQAKIAKNKKKERYDPHDDPNASHDAMNEPLPIHQRYNVDLRKFYDSIGFWASKPTFYAFMLHSRHDRLQAVALGKELQVLDGRRAAHIFYHTKKKYLQMFYQLRTRLKEDCEKIIAPPLSLKELSQLPFGDLQTLFRSHAKLAARLDDMEHFLFFKMTKVDYFIPMMTSAPVFARDIGELDVALLNADTLMNNVVFEKNLQIEEESNQSVVKNTNENAKTTVTMSNNHTAIKISDQSLYKKPGQKNSSNASVLTMNAAELAQRKEEKEDVLAGKMTFSLSQSLDGCGYLLEGQQGAKDMLIRHLAHDECLLLWHLPNIMTQKLTVILVWRENSLSKHQFFSAKSAYAARQEDAEKRKKHGERVYQRMKAQQRAAAEKAFGHEGIVMEMAQCDLTSTHFLQFLQRYVDALHAKPAPVRMTLASDALNALSCALSISELFLMLPLHVRSLVICCPPVMRLVPWHLLLMETSDHRNILATVDDLTKGPKANNAKQRNNTSSNNENSNKNSGSEKTPTKQAVDDDIRVIHICEKYCVRLGPTLTLFELCSTAATQLKHSVGMHRLCAIDGDDRMYARSHPSMTSTAGIRGADLETLCAVSLWSADPDDARILRDFSCTKSQLKTSVFGDLQYVKQHLDRFDGYCEEIKLKRATATNPNPDKDLVTAMEEEAQAMKEQGIEPGAFSQPILKPLFKKMMNHNKRFQHGPKQLKIGKVDDDEDDDDDDDKEDEMAKERREREHQEEERREQRLDVFYLSSNRVCHIAARKALYYDDFDYEQDILEHLQHTKKDNQEIDFEEIDALYHEHDTAAFHIVREHQYLHLQNQHNQVFNQPHYKGKSEYNESKSKNAKKPVLESAADGYFTAKDIVHQWYMKNNALTILSRFGYCDDLVDLQKQHRAVQHTASVIEALHCAGAAAVLYPIWDTTSTPSGAGTLLDTGTAQGTSAAESGLLVLARLLFILRFYATLPARSRDHRLSVVECVRRVQAWLRNVTANDVIAFVAKTPLPSLARETIIEEMEALCAASVAEDEIQQRILQQEGKETTKEKEKGNRRGGTRQFFTHFLLWGSFCVSGYGGNVHHPDLTLPDEDVFGLEDAEADVFNATQGLDDEDRDQSIRDTKREIQRLLLEARVLRMEGRNEEARLLEVRVRELRKILFQRRIKAMKRFGWKAGRGFLDTLDYLDKTFLDQEEFSDDEDDDAGGYKAFLQKQKELRRQELEKEKKKKKWNKKGNNEEEEEEEEDDDGSLDLDDDLDDDNEGTKIQIDVDDGSPLKNAAPLESKELRKQKVFNPLTDHKRDPKDVAYDAWRSKVGGLNMAVKAPTLKNHGGRASVTGGASTAAASHQASSATSKGDKYNSPDKNGKLGDDSYEYNMMQKVKNGPPKPAPLPPPRNTDDDDEPLEDEEEEEEEEDEEIGIEDEEDGEEEDDDEEDDYDEDDALAKYRKHKRKKKNGNRGFFPWSKVTKNVRSYGEIVQMLSEQPQKIMEESTAKLKENLRHNPKKQQPAAKKYEMKPTAKDRNMKIKPSAADNHNNNFKKNETGEEEEENETNGKEKVDDDEDEDEELGYKGSSDSNCVIN